MINSGLKGLIKLAWCLYLVFAGYGMSQIYILLELTSDISHMRHSMVATYIQYFQRRNESTCIYIKLDMIAEYSIIHIIC